MVTLYWGLEFTKVLLCYFFILFIWPSVIFRKYLKGKSRIFRFCFCATAQIVLINTVVLGLGLGYLLKPWIVNILFYGPFLFSVGRVLLSNRLLRDDLHKLTAGTLGWRSLCLALWGRFMSWLRGLWRRVHHHLVEYILLAALVAYGVLYFSYFPLVDPSYTYSDMNTHHNWIYGLIQGQAFSGSIYPEAMHCVIYLMHTISGLSVYSCNLFLGCIHVVVLLISMYCLMREIFCWRGTPLLALTLFLIYAVNGREAVMSMARLQGTLPGEYGLFTVYLCALFLLRFLKESFQDGWRKDPRAWLNDENLIVFSLSLAASIAIHYYAAIIAFFVCLPFAIVYIRRVFSRACYPFLAAAARSGVIIALLPIGCALLVGIPFHGSIRWALNVISGDESGAIVAEAESADMEPLGSGSPEDSVRDSVFFRVTGIVKAKTDIFYQTYCGLLGNTLGAWTVCVSVLLAVFWLACMLSGRLRAAADILNNYMPVIGASFLIMVLYAAPYMGLPEVVSIDRLPTTAYPLLFMVVVVPADMLFSALQRFSPNWILQMASVACVAVICVVTVETGHYHGYLYKLLLRYRPAVNVTNSIVRSFPENTYTIVSTTDDLYAVFEHGYLEELVTFLQTAEQGEEYYLPTEYVFVYVEKKPFQLAQNHYLSGPAWLATDIYADNNPLLGEASKYPEVIASQISTGAAQGSVLGFSSEYGSYVLLDVRTALNSKAYKWCQDFAALYEYEMNVYYEDEDFICYYFRQNPYSLYNLSIWNRDTDIT